MADPKKLAEDWLPNLTPEQRASWLQTYAPAPPPASPPGRRVINAPLTTIEAPVSAPPSEGGVGLDRALGALQRGGGGHANGATSDSFASVAGRAGAAPFGTTQDAADAAADARQPRNGDWAGARKTQEQNELAGRKANLEGATFYSPTGPGAGASTGAPTLVSKGGRTPASWTTQTQEGTKLSPETVEKAEHAEGSKMDAAAWGRNAGIAEASREFAILDEHARLQKAHADDVARRAEQQRIRVDNELAKLNTMTKKVSSQEIDPQKFIKDRGALGLFMTGLSLLGGAYGHALQARAGMTNTSNVAMDTLNASIQQEIDSQKANAQLNNQKLDAQRSILGDTIKAFGEGERADNAAHIQYLEYAKTRLAAGAAESKSDWAQARYRDAIANIDGEIAGRREKWDAQTQDHVTRVQHDVNAPAQYAGGAGGPIGKRDREEISEISKELTKAGIPQARSALADIDRTIDTFGDGDIAGVGPIKDHVPSYFISDEGVRNRQAVAHVKNGLRKEVAGASLTDGEKEELNKELEGAHDAASLRRVVQSFRQSLHKKEVTIRAGGSDIANAEFDRRQSTNESRAVPLNSPSTAHVKAPE